MKYFGETTTLMLLLIILLIIILLLIFVWHYPRTKPSLKALFNLFSINKLVIKDLIQLTTSVIAIIIAIVALNKGSIRDEASSKRYSESVNRELQQHNEIMNVYSEQQKLLSKYNQSADSMLVLLKIQSSTAELQFENQKILTQPGVNINFQIQDTNRTSLVYDKEFWIMPEVIFAMYNFGSRIAKDVTLKVEFISPRGKTIHSFNIISEKFIYPKATLREYLFPIITKLDKDFFLIDISLEWTDEFNNNTKIKQHFIQKCLREKNNYYTVGKGEEVYAQMIKDILKKPSKFVIVSDTIRKYMYDTYNK